MTYAAIVDVVSTLKQVSNVHVSSYSKALLVKHVSDSLSDMERSSFFFSLISIRTGQTDNYCLHHDHPYTIIHSKRKAKIIGKEDRKGARVSLSVVLVRVFIILYLVAVAHNNRHLQMHQTKRAHTNISETTNTVSCLVVDTLSSVVETWQHLRTSVGI